MEYSIKLQLFAFKKKKKKNYDYRFVLDIWEPQMLPGRHPVVP